MSDTPHEDQASAAPRETPHWRLKPHAKLLWMRAQREAHRPVHRQEPVESDPEVERCIREGKAVTGPYDPYR